MKTLLLGFVMLVGVIFTSLEGSSKIYFQYRSFAIVVIGTLAVLIFSSEAAVLRMVFELFRKLFKPEEVLEDHILDIQNLSKNRNHSLSTHAHPLMVYASELWSKGIDSDLFIVLLSQKRNDLISRAIDAIFTIRSLAKYPPALGMTGTVMGIVSVFYSLDKNKNSIGINLAVAMTATFMGLILANLVISPLADRLSVRQIRQERLLQGLYEVILLINRDEPVILIEGEVHDRAA